MRLINKTMDRMDLFTPEAKRLIEEINLLILELKRKNLRYSSWYGQFELAKMRRKLEQQNRGYGYELYPGAIDDLNIPWFLYWEIVWVYLNGGFKEGGRVLDMGGTSSLFSYFLCYKGCEVTTIDINEGLVENADTVADRMGWSLKNFKMDMRSMTFQPESFDHITSICVYEHIPINDRVEVNKDISVFLKKNGRFSITFDYLNPSRVARISSPQDVYSQFVDTTGFSVQGNADFFDNGKRYLLHPFYHTSRPWVYKLLQISRSHFSLGELFETKTANDYTFGALFLEKSN